jgi:hypothetical protein
MVFFIFVNPFVDIFISNCLEESPVGPVAPVTVAIPSGPVGPV